MAPLYEGRASADIDVKAGKANLKLNSITLADNKVFECRVQIPKDDEGKLMDTTRLVVLGKRAGPHLDSGWRCCCLFPLIIFTVNSIA